VLELSPAATSVRGFTPALRRCNRRLRRADAGARFDAGSRCPTGVPDELGGLRRPLRAVSLHSITRHPPPADGKVLVYGAGSLGSAAIAVLRSLYPDVEVAVVARFPAQVAFAEKLGAHKVFRP